MLKRLMRKLRVPKLSPKALAVKTLDSQHSVNKRHYCKLAS
ncbi:hypothetical protein ACOJUR_01075 [Alicyclobacillus tolerans]|uniref:Transposase n=1 Tax=Alicyclobacillus tolerans TaxID=90970 RepID=A0ABT9LUD9_9BACL|nr:MULTISPECIES: hypothetical protein [Alicyclobacillus]MDP9727886.1 hypothetical protein [Alicyclobacillus tengchongensis]